MANKWEAALLRRRASLGCVAALVTAFSLLTPSVAVAQESSCQRESSWADVRADLATEVVALTNAHRMTLGLSPLSPASTLTKAAEWKAAHMGYYGYFSHDDPANPTRTWDQRIRDCGYAYGAGENIAYGYPSPESVLEGWLNSPGHRLNIETAGYRAIGVGVAIADNGRIYWVQNFGSRADSTPNVVTPSPVATTAPTTEPTTAPTTGPTPSPSASPTTTPTTTPTTAPDPNGPSPVAAEDAAVTREDQPAPLDPLANDFVGSGGSLKLLQFEDPAHGRIVRADGELLYRPDADFSGRDTFHYWMSDQLGRTCGARITVTVEPENDAPVARRDSARVRPRGTLFLDVLKNDVDVDGDSFQLIGVDGRARFGSLSVDADSGVMSYRARRGTSGKVETLSYTVTDDQGASSEGRIRIRIRG